MENECYRVRVRSYVRGPRRVLVERHRASGYYVAGDFPVPDGIDAAELEAEVLSRLPCERS